MPEVPRISRQIRREPLPGPRVQPGASSEEAFGGGEGLEKIASLGREVSSEFQKTILERKRQVDEAILRDADLELGLLQNKLHLELSRFKGKDAASAADFIENEWSKKTKEISDTLKSDELKSIFNLRARQRFINLNESLQVHMANEFERYDKEQHEAYLENAISQAALNYGDQEKVNLSIFQQEEEIKAFAERNGKSEEWVKSKIFEARTKTYSSVINQMLANGQTEMAVEFYKKTSPYIVDKERISSLIQKEIIKQNAFLEGERILSETSPEKIPARLAEIKDENLRSETEKAVNAMLREKEANFNINEARIASLVAEGKYSLAQLEADKNSVSDDFYRAAQFAIENRSGFFSKLSGGEKVFISLVQDFVELSKADIYDRNRLMMNFRNKVLANASRLNSKDFRKLISWTNPNSIEEFHEKSQTLDLAVKAVQFYIENFPYGGFMEVVSKVLGSFDKTPEEIQKTVKESIREDILRKNPSLFGREDISNAIFSAEDGFKKIYAGKSALKPDFKLKKEPEGMIRMISPSGKKGFIPREKLEEALKKGFKLD